MTDLTRLEALERGQVDILHTMQKVEACLGSVKKDVGRLQGSMEGWISERRGANEATDKLQAAFLRECSLRHETIAESLERLDAMVNDHHGRIKVMEKCYEARIVGWSLAKKVWVGLVAFVAFIGSTVGVVTAVMKLIG